MKHVMGKSPRRAVIAGTAIALYLLMHLATLARHPFVHSDEAWLAVLTRAMIVARSPAATEEVFRLTPRHPHALKTLYHALQAPFLAVSWSAFAARLPSLAAGAAALFFLVRIAGECGLIGWRRFVPSVFMAADPQFWYIAHLGRQEMIVVALFLWAWSLRSRRRRAALAALPLAAGIFVHPNIFIVATAVAALYGADVVGALGKKKEWRRPSANLAVFAAVLGAAAIAGVGASLLMDRGFIAHFTAFGGSVGAGDSAAMKILGLPRFLGKMWERRAGTYYLADVRPLFILGAAGYAANAVRALRRKSGRGRLLVLPALLVGITVVGKYAPPTVFFLTAPVHLALGEALFGEWRTGAVDRRRRDRAGLAAGAAAFGLLAVVSFAEVRTSLNRPSYAEYVRFLREAVGPMEDGVRVLANLNTAFAFGYDRLVIWRDFAGLDEDETLDAALETYGVRWVVLPDELEYIYRRRPVWNGLYGNLRWYPALLGVLERRGEETERRTFPDYAMRIVPYMDSGDWGVGVYRLDE